MYSPYHDVFVDISFKLHKKQGGSLGRRTGIEHRIELLQDNVQPVYSAPSRAGPETCEFERAETDRTINQNVTKPAQTE